MHLFCVLRIKYKLHCLISKDIWVTVWMFVVLMELCCIVWWFVAVTGCHLLLQSSLSLCVSLCSHQRPMRDGNFLWVSLNDPPSHLPPSLFLSRLFPFSFKSSSTLPCFLNLWPVLCPCHPLSLSLNPPFPSKNNSSFLSKALASNSLKCIFISSKHISDHPALLHSFQFSFYFQFLFILFYLSFSYIFYILNVCESVYIVLVLLHIHIYIYICICIFFAFYTFIFVCFILYI